MRLISEVKLGTPLSFAFVTQVTHYPTAVNFFKVPMTDFFLFSCYTLLQVLI